MALRPFVRQQKQNTDDETTLGAADEFAQFFSIDSLSDEPGTNESPPSPSAEMPPLDVTAEEPPSAGWYTDTTDPGLMRYWDGFHMTGQTMLVDCAPPAVPESRQAQPAATSADLISSAEPDENAEQKDEPGTGDATVAEPEPERSVAAGPPVSQSGLEVQVEPAEKEMGPTAPGSAEREIGEAIAVGRRAGAHEPLTVVANPGHVNIWVARTERAVAEAEATDTPDAWENAAKTAQVVSEMAQTLRTAADIRQVAAQLDAAAATAQRQADEAETAAAGAQSAVADTEQAVRQAAETAKALAKKAEEAKAEAERIAGLSPQAADRARDAAQAAETAKRRAELVDEIVARAHRTDTPEAWSEARRSSEKASGPDARETRLATV